MKFLSFLCTKWMENCEAMTSSPHSFAYSYRMFKKCFLKICETSKCHNFLIFQPIFIRFSLWCLKFFTLSSEIKLNLLWSSSLMIWHSPGLPGWRKVNFITVTRRPRHPNIAAGTSPGFLPTLCEKWSGFFYVHRVFLSYTRDRRFKDSSERLGNEDKAPCPRALLPGQGSNRGPPVWKSEALTTRPESILWISLQRVNEANITLNWGYTGKIINRDNI